MKKFIYFFMLLIVDYLQHKQVLESLLSDLLFCFCINAAEMKHSGLKPHAEEPLQWLTNVYNTVT